MFRLLFCVKRLPSLSRDEFQRYWREQHGPLVQRHAAALRIRRYVQVHTIDDPLNAALRASRGAEAEYDGVAELWWDSRADFEAASQTPEGRVAGMALLEDERRFIDLARSSLFVAAEHVIVD